MTFSIALLIWMPVSAILFACMAPARALTLAILVGWLYLPVGAIPIQGFWDIDKVLATNIGCIVGLILFGRQSFRLRFTLADLGLIAFVVATFVSSIANQLGAYDGLSTMCYTIFYYAVPFTLGRIVLRTLDDVRTAVQLLVLGTAMYALLALWEMRMSPQIHSTLYGFFQHTFAQHKRWGLYRPIVCFSHALALGMFFAWTSLVAIGLWREAPHRRIFGVPPLPLVVLCLLGLGASLSFGPWGLFVFGFALLFCRGGRTIRRFTLMLPFILPVCWLGSRYLGVNDGQWAASALTEVAPDRARTLQYRVDAETVLQERAKLRPLFGWGGWDRNNVVDERGRAAFATDSLWTIVLGRYGLLGLSAFYVWWGWPRR